MRQPTGLTLHPTAGPTSTWTTRCGELVPGPADQGYSRPIGSCPGKLTLPWSCGFATDAELPPQRGGARVTHSIAIDSRDWRGGAMRVVPEIPANSGISGDVDPIRAGF